MEGLDLLVSNGNVLYFVRFTTDSRDEELVKEFLRASGPCKTDGFYRGPRPEMQTSWSSNVVPIIYGAGIKGVYSVERYEWFAEKPDFDNLTQICVRGADLPAELSQRQPRCHLADGIVPVNELKDYSKAHGLQFDAADISFYSQLFEVHDPTVAELYDLANSNSEHSRHHLFRAHFLMDHPDYGVLQTQKSMMELIQKPLTLSTSSNSLVAFCDNASAIKGCSVNKLVPQQPGQPCALRSESVMTHISFTAETHNFPTGVAPFQGATTGTGGRIRDTQAIGTGGTVIAGTCGYCVGSFRSTDHRIHPIDMLLRASDGASDYGNKMGEPVIQGFCRSFEITSEEGVRTEWVKPIMFSGGLGYIAEEHLWKKSPQPGWKIVRVGGPTYRLGLGGGAASSTTQRSSDKVDDKLLSAVQRGDAQCENRLNRWLTACIAMGAGNPIQSVHDQGAGGMANVTKEILEGVGGRVDLSKVTRGDFTLSAAELWVSESQEQLTVLIKPDDIDQAKQIAYRENINFDIVGVVEATGRIVVELNGKRVVDLPLDQITPPAKTFEIPYNRPDAEEALVDISRYPHLTGEKDDPFGICKVLQHPDVGSKRFLTNKVDRSVSGLIAQQQCVGPRHTPVADFALTALSYHGCVGAAMAIGERPIIHQTAFGDEKCIRWAIYEMLTNLMWVVVTDMSDIKCSGNWMWPAGTPEEKARMLAAVRVASDVCCELGIAIDGGKDSVSMSAQLPSGERVDSPPSFVISGYVGCPDIRVKIPTGFQHVDSYVLHVPIWSTAEMGRIFRAVQQLIRDGLIYAGHDVSDGGLITTLCEMCFAAEDNIGILITGVDPTTWFHDEPGIVMEVSATNLSPVVSTLTVTSHNGQFSPTVVGKTTPEWTLEHWHSQTCVSVGALRNAWEHTATMLEARQTAGVCAQMEHDFLITPRHTRERRWAPIVSIESIQPTVTRVAILRGEGTNGDREMAAVFDLVGFEVHDLTTSDLTTHGRIKTLDAFKGLVFPGGFTYADVLGAAAGWQAVLTQNVNANTKLTAFRERSDTFILGVCNGCQLLSRLGWIGATSIDHNTSQRFESRFVTVKVSEQPDNRGDVWLKRLMGHYLGVWVAHGEGRIIGEGNTAFRYVDPETFEPTEAYPHNPNGSFGGVAGQLSDDGRVLGLMPHPERCFKQWQLPWCPPEWRSSDFTPWIGLFYSAYEWCTK